MSALKTSDFYYDLPEELIAQTPADPRDSSRLLVYHRDNREIEHRVFREITDYLRAGDVLVVNRTKVLPARLFAETQNGGRVEVLLLKRLKLDEWEVLVRPGKKCRIGTRLTVNGELSLEVTGITQSGERHVCFFYEGAFEDVLSRAGSMPLPPYIHEKLKDPNRYQTVYCKENGSAAAPTAGLHFTPELLEQVREIGVKVCYITLHVGLGTFRPVKAEDIQDHEMHSEFCMISQETADTINKTKKNGGRVICVGTTSCRTIESFAAEDGTMSERSGWTNIFIYPGYQFKVLDALITNFHLPQSTLIMLVSALAGREHVLAAYEEAVRERYRFFSFGDAMFIS